MCSILNRNSCFMGYNDVLKKDLGKLASGGFGSLPWEELMRSILIPSSDK